MTENNQLSDREQEILKLVATGASNKEIAEKLVISKNTVKVHLRNIFGKIGVASRTEAAMYAVGAGIVTDGVPTGTGHLESGQGEVDTFSISGILLRNNNWILFGFLSFIAIIAISFLVLNFFGLLNNQSANEPISSASDWQELNLMPTARYGLATSAYDNYLFTIAGTGIEGVTGVVERYDTLSDEWNRLLDKPTPVSEVSGTVLGGKIYIPGGLLASGGLSYLLEIYDPQQDEWTRGANLPIPLSAYGLTSFEGKLYLFGGWDGEEFTNTVYEYDPELDEWTPLPEMPTPRGHLGVAVVGRKIYVLGGQNEDGVTPVNEVFTPDLVDQESEMWETQASLPESGYGMGATSVADTIYLIGGFNEDGGQLSSFAFIPHSGEWRSVSEPPTEIGSHLGLESIGTNIYGIGGVLNSAPQDINLSYQSMYTISIPLITK
jgi:DNA-binding CsgD family transcriptional regulator/N-acetylneuraminic acid mutarotase